MMAWCLALALAANPASAPEEPVEGWYGFSFRLGALFLVPLGRSQPMELEVAPGAAQLALTPGPVAGSYVTFGNRLMPAATIGYSFPFLRRQLSVQTILALPFSLSMTAGGTLANESLAPVALGNLPTGIPAFGPELGTVRVLPPVLTLVWRFLPESIVRPFLGAGVSLLIPLEARVTNQVLTEVATPRVQIQPKAGLVVQAGVDVRLWRWLFLTADVKYIAGLDLEAKVSGVWVRTPLLPLYESVEVGGALLKVSVNPLVMQLGIGVDL